MRLLLIFMLAVGLFVVGPKLPKFFKFNVTVHGHGPVLSETREHRDFHALDVSIGADVEVRIGEGYSTILHAQQNLLPYIKTEVRNGVLHIFSEGNVWSDEDMKIEIVMPALDGIDVTGSGDIRVMTPLTTDRLHLDVAGSADVHIPELNAQAIEGEITGSGKINVSGTAGDIKMDISGSGDLLAENLMARALTASITGSGTVRCQIQERLKADVMGSGSVFYRGNPQIEQDITGSGEVKRID